MTDDKECKDSNCYCCHPANEHRCLGDGPRTCEECGAVWAEKRAEEADEPLRSHMLKRGIATFLSTTRVLVQ